RFSVFPPSKSLVAMDNFRFSAPIDISTTASDPASFRAEATFFMISSPVGAASAERVGASTDAESARAKVKAANFWAVFVIIHSPRGFSPCPASVLPLLPAISPLLAPHDALSLIRNDENKKVRAHGSIT